MSRNVYYCGERVTYSVSVPGQPTRRGLSRSRAYRLAARLHWDAMEARESLGDPTPAVTVRAHRSKGVELGPVPADRWLPWRE